MKKQALFIALGVSEKPGISGGETRFMEVAKGWEEKGYEIHLLSTGGGPYLCEKFDLKATHHVIRAKNKGRLGFLFRFFSAFFIPKSLKDFREGIVISTNEQLYDILPGLIIKLRNFSEIKWGVVTHWLPPFRFWVRKQSTIINSFLFLVSERISLYMACIFANKILAVSNATKKQIQNDVFARLALKKVEAVECGVNYDEIRDASGGVKKEYEAVFMKRIQAVKGAFDLPKIWKEVIKLLPEAKLYIIGSGIDEERVKDVVEKEGLSENIIFTGPIFDFDKKIREVSKAKIFILPSYEENWAIVIGEGMACGTTVVTYDLPELREVWGNNVFYIPVGDTQEFAKVVVDLLKNDEKRQEMRTKALGFVKKYDWKNISERELNLLVR